VTLFEYRLVTAAYGLRIRMVARSSHIIDLSGAIASVLAFFGAQAVVFVGVILALRDNLAFATAGALVILLSAWAAVRFLGDLGRIMGAAASDRRASELLRADMHVGMRNHGAYAALRSLYDPHVRAANDALREAGWNATFEPLTIGSASTGGASHYAAIVMALPAAASLEDLFGSICPLPSLGKVMRATQGRQDLVLAWRGGEVIDRETGQHFEEGDNYCLAEMKVDNRGGNKRLVIDVAVGTYGEISRTCESLINEFALFGHLTRSNRFTRQVGGERVFAIDSDTLLSYLPWRKLCHEDSGRSGDIFLRPRGRAVGLGVSVATIDRKAGVGVVGYVARRSKNVGTYPDALHTVPAGNCNTYDTDKPSGSSAVTTVPPWYLEGVMRCEFIEEWLDDHDLRLSKMQDWRGAVDRRWRAKLGDLRSITLTGIAFDLLNLRPEICALITVFPEEGNLNYEWTGKARAWPLAEIGLLDPTDAVQSGVASLALAAARVDPQRVRISRRPSHNA
jgi:hypothetical protein